MARYLKLRVRDGAGLISVGTTGEAHSFGAGDEFVVRFEDAAPLLRGKTRRALEVLDDFEDDSTDTKPDLEFSP
jgi:hypothetical protein